MSARRTLCQDTSPSCKFKPDTHAHTVLEMIKSYALCFCLQVYVSQSMLSHRSKKMSDLSPINSKSLSDSFFLYHTYFTLFVQRMSRTCSCSIYMPKKKSLFDCWNCSILNVADLWWILTLLLLPLLYGFSLSSLIRWCNSSAAILGQAYVSFES